MFVSSFCSLVSSFRRRRVGSYISFLLPFLTVVVVVDDDDDDDDVDDNNCCCCSYLLPWFSSIHKPALVELPLVG